MHAMPHSFFGQLFKQVAMLETFLHDKQAYIKLSQATETSEGRAMRLHDNAPCLFCGDVKVVPWVI